MLLQVAREPCACTFPESCDSQAGSIPPTRAGLRAAASSQAAPQPFVDGSSQGSQVGWLRRLLLRTLSPSPAVPCCQQDLGLKESRARQPHRPCSTSAGSGAMRAEAAALLQARDVQSDGEQAGTGVGEGTLPSSSQAQPGSSQAQLESLHVHQVGHSPWHSAL